MLSSWVKSLTRVWLALELEVKMEVLEFGQPWVMRVPLRMGRLREAFWPSGLFSPAAFFQLCFSKSNIISGKKYHSQDTLTLYFILRILPQFQAEDDLCQADQLGDFMKAVVIV